VERAEGALNPGTTGASLRHLSDRLRRRWDAASPWLAAAALLGAFHFFFLLFRYPSAGAGSLLARRLLAAGFPVGFSTFLLLAPAVLLLRRWHPEPRGDATWRTSLGVVAAVAGWMVADRLLRGPLVPSAAAPWVAAAAALVAGLLAALWPPLPRRWRWTLAAAGIAGLAASLLLLPGAFGGSRRAPAPAAEPAASDRPDVVLISLDTLRADRIGAFGGEPSLTPALDRFAGGGVVFRRAVASSPWTVPSMALAMTGLPTLHHRAGLAVGPGPAFLRTPLDDGVETLAEHFAAAGYRTLAVVANAFLSAERGWDQGFEELRNPLLDSMHAAVFLEMPLTRLLLRAVPAERLGDPRARGLTATALRWLAADDPRPIFLWIHYIDPHSPYRADPDRLEIGSWVDELEAEPAVAPDGTVVGERFAAVHRIRGGTLTLSGEDRRRIADYYDRSVRYLDEHLAPLFAALEERARERPVVAAALADHGEELWDHGGFEHGHDYYREVTRVPLIFWGPGRVPAGGTVDRPVGLVDVAPTLLELAGLESPGGEAGPPAPIDEGVSLVPLWRVDEGGQLPESPPRFSGGNLYGHPSVLLEHGPWRFILRGDGREELYHLPTDPGERRDVSFLEPRRVAGYRHLLEPRLQAFLAVREVDGGRGATDSETSPEMSPEELEALRSLGYVQ